MPRHIKQAALTKRQQKREDAAATTARRHDSAVQRKTGLYGAGVPQDGDFGAAAYRKAAPS